MNTWIISDTHFGHGNIIPYCSRPFRDAEHMDRTMTERWQARVQPEDLVYHLGDVMLTARRTDEEIQKFLQQLPGRKILICGNHDKSAARMMEFGFDFACEEMVIIHRNYRLLLVHKPQYRLPPGIDYILHGHIHNSTPESRRPYLQKGEMYDIPDFNINMSVEAWNYEPVTLRYVLSTVKQREHGNVRKV